MIKIITELEAQVLSDILENALYILEEEGYDYEAKDVERALELLARLQNKHLEERDLEIDD